MNEETQRAQDIHKKAILINACDTSHEHDFDGRYVNKLVEAGVTAVNVTCYGIRSSFSQAIKEINKWRVKCKNLRDTVIATTIADIEKAKNSRKIAVILSGQNSKPVDDDINNLSVLHDLGIRVMTLTYQRKNIVGDGCGERTDCGLSNFGIKLVEEMNQLGIVVDLAHVGFATSMEAMEISKAPVIFSHSNARALCNDTRNIVDEQIKSLAEKGGVIGVMGLSVYLHNKGKSEGSTIDHYIDQVDYISSMVGVNHVGIGLDIGYGIPPEFLERLKFDYPEFPDLAVTLRRGIYTPRELKEISGLIAITKGLVARGYSDNDILKILGGNFLKVFKKAWR